ncbi:MAG TPA: lipopolysaccharide heptosyltransferase I [Chlamydiales bacterium]|nr:lipopolysaccharide heptosyltransferase I [Chlamydiales bacterium]
MTKKVLLIKLTSLGDLIHALPALNDAALAIPDIEIDWAIDKSFSEVALWHRAVKRFFPTSHRQWRKKLSHLSTYSDVRAFVRNLRASEYDLVIDGQGNFKSAFLALLARGKRVGFDRHSVREWIAHFAYQKKVTASWKIHAIDRLRILFSRALDYPLPLSPPDFSLKEGCFVKPPFELPPSYLVFIHSASWKTKLWPEAHWKELIALASHAGYPVLLPWGSPGEEERAKRLAALPEAHVLPRVSLSEMGYILKRAKGAVCVDTGLSHLAAALRVPSVTLYGATDSGLIGTSGHILQSNLPCAPCNQKSCKFKVAIPPCLAQITPQTVFQKLLRAICS